MHCLHINARFWRIFKIGFVCISWCVCVALLLYAAESRFSFKKNVPIDKQLNWTDTKWMPVTDKVFVYSAFHDTRDNKSVIRIVAIGQRDDKTFGNFVCISQGPSNIFSLPTNFDVMAEHHDHQNSAVFFFCHLTSREAPEMVGLSYRKGYPVWIKVHKEAQKASNIGTKLSVCVRPMYKDVFISPRVPEFIQVWQQLGASHFVFYDYQTPPEVKKFLNVLSQTGLVSFELLPWNLPVPEESIHCAGQLAFLQDCLYRTMTNYEWIAPVDLDEYMIPVQNVTLLEVLEEHRGPRTAGFRVQHALFCLNNFTSGLMTQNVLHRHVKLGGNRNKCVYVSKNVEMLGIHFPWELVKNTKIVDLKPEVVLMNHYRTLEAYKDCKVYDQRALRMSEALKNSQIMAAYRQINT